jgi:hypothetical protein
MVTGCALGLQLSSLAAEPPFSDASPWPGAAPTSVQPLPDAPSVVAQAQTPDKKPVPPPDNSGRQSGESSQPAPQQPKGAAAAEVQKSTGTAASTPSGAAIAPAKQKRSRSLLIRLGALAGAGIAIGTVVALSSGAPGKPPGAN